jgi:hypothetical protein
MLKNFIAEATERHLKKREKKRKQRLHNNNLEPR